MSTTPAVREIEQALRREIAVIVDRPEHEIAIDASLESLGFDSIRLMEIIIFIEKNYQLNLVEQGLTREALKNLSSLAAAVAEQTRKGTGKSTDQVR